MSQLTPGNDKRTLPLMGKLFNKTFYRFLFSFIAVIAGVLMLILVLGVGSEV